jgi:hypothetical protein
MKNFNIFEILNISHLEIKHSDVLAYLFDNKESHNLKDTFLKEFIYEVEAASNIDLNLTLDDSYSIKREYAIPKGFVDLLLISYKHKTIIVIENKIQSKERDNQLKKYKEHFKDKGAGYKLVFIYLTMNDEKASDDEYISVNYTTVIKSLERVLRYKNYSEKIEYFLEDYLEVLLKKYKLKSSADLINFRKTINIERGKNG